MRFNKVTRNLFVALGFCATAFLALASFAAPSKGAVHIYAAFPDLASQDGTFTATGAFTLSGDALMIVTPNANGTIAHCVMTLTPSDGSGTITIHQECQFSTNPSKGRWEIVSGTGAYADLKGNGSLLMPGFDEDMTGTIY
jgi:hypothetical protein